MTLVDEAIKLRELYEAKTVAGQADSAAKAAHAQQEQRVLEVMQRERQASVRPTELGYTFTAVTDKVKGQLDDRVLYLQAMLEEEPSLQELADALAGDAGYTPAQVLEQMQDAMLNLTFLQISARQEVMNRQARKAQEDHVPPPAGLAIRPAPYVSVTKA